jgi:hypothetical protein
MFFSSVLFGFMTSSHPRKVKTILVGYLPVQFWPCPEPHPERFSPLLWVRIRFGFMAVNLKSK